MNAEPPTSSTSPGTCVVVTPEADGRPERVPEALIEALSHHQAGIEHAASAYHAITRIARPSNVGRTTLLIVEPERSTRAQALAIAAMTHAPSVAVWRYDPEDDAPVAPYVPTKEGVTPEQLVDEPDLDDEPARSRGDTPTPTSSPIHASAGTPELRIVGDSDHAPGGQMSDPPLVSSEELSMLLGTDDDRRRGRS